MKRLLVLFIAAALLTTPLSAEILIFASGETERGASRIAIFDGHPRGLTTDQSEFVGQVTIHFGKPQWKPEYEMKKPENGVWRLGADYWTTLENNLPIRLGGKRLEPGQHFLAARYSDSGWRLLVLDPERVRKVHLDPFVFQAFPERYLKGSGSALVAEIPLKSSPLEEKAERLSILLQAHSKTLPAQATLQIRWGGTELSAEVEAEVAAPASD
ncbi:MAG TPA: DUF2911 domain-containing protein [Acidobacteriota bacterium]|nr:DUF2911 domain-containing protein [Acidobacteriota bacterium]